MKYETQDVVEVSIIPDHNPFKVLVSIFSPLYERSYGTKRYKFTTYSSKNMEDLERKREEAFQKIMARACNESYALNEFTVVRKKKAIRKGRKKITQASVEEFTYYRFPFSDEQLRAFDEHIKANQGLEPKYKYKVSY
mmetsp:Transcript_4850/g.7023  ORF Transcript_4850/g.7023 Transcript_4850/m.7023 type:complete len:138 (+) Transcript_4850:160-573(+)